MRRDRDLSGPLLTTKVKQALRSSVVTALLENFLRWYAFFDADNLYSLYHLEDHSRTPKRVRQRAITPLQEQRILALRRKHIRYGREKIARLYRETYHEAISSWKAQKVIEVWQLYYHPAKTARIRAKKKHPKKRRITELTPAWYQKQAGYTLCPVPLPSIGML